MCISAHTGTTTDYAMRVDLLTLIADPDFTQTFPFSSDASGHTALIVQNQ